MTKKKLIIINSREKESLRILSKKIDCFNLIVIDSDKSGEINISLDQRYLWSSSIDFNFPKQNPNSFINNLNTYEKYMLTASEMNYFTSKKYNIEKYNFQYYAPEIFLLASKFLSEHTFKEIIFLSPIDDYPILAFALLSKFFNKTKYLVRTGIEDKVYLTDDFLYRGIEFPSDIQVTSLKDKSVQSSSTWNDYSKIMNSKSLNKLKNNDSFSKDSFQDQYDLISSHWKILNDFSLKKNIIYFPLHCDPGRTTQPEAGIFQNQLISIYLLSSLLADDYQILVKEHPRQFDDLEDFKFYRGNYFYNNIIKLKSVDILQVDEDTKEILNKASVVVTANGTSGWEALKAGKPVILFGNPWYSKCLGAIHINELVEKPYILKELIREKQNIISSAEKLENFITTKFTSYLSLDRVLKFSNIKNNEKNFWELIGIK